MSKLNTTTIIGSLLVILLGASVLGVFKLNNNFIRFEATMTVWATGTDRRITQLEQINIDRLNRLRGLTR